MGNVKGLKCKECKREFPKEAIHVCEYCFGPLEVDYDYEKISKKIETSRNDIRQAAPPQLVRPPSLKKPPPLRQLLLPNPR